MNGTMTLEAGKTYKIAQSDNTFWVNRFFAKVLNVRSNEVDVEIIAIVKCDYKKYVSGSVQTLRRSNHMFGLLA